MVNLPKRGDAIILAFGGVDEVPCACEKDTALVKGLSPVMLIISEIIDHSIS